MDHYLNALRTEIGLWGKELGSTKLETVFFGGGTPSYLPQGAVTSLISKTRDSFDFVRNPEITLEANPDDLNEKKLESFIDSGVNRLSIGIQSLEDSLLKTLGRRHSSAEALGAYHMAHNAGFENISIDLMYGLPGQTANQWSTTLESALSVEPSHISMYCLTLEDGTPMEHQVSTGSIPIPDDDLAADMYLMAEEITSKMGYRHYEISNWAQPGKESRHNLTYWQNGSFLGVGPGAHSYIYNHRFSNIKSPREYIKLLGKTSHSFSSKSSPQNSIPFSIIPVIDQIDRVDRELEMAETMMMNLRLDTGVIKVDFTSRFGVSPNDVYSEMITTLATKGLLELSNGSIKLSDRGRLLSNEVFMQFF